MHFVRGRGVRQTDPLLGNQNGRSSVPRGNVCVVKGRGDSFTPIGWPALLTGGRRPLEKRVGGDGDKGWLDEEQRAAKRSRKAHRPGMHTSVSRSRLQHDISRKESCQHAPEVWVGLSNIYIIGGHLKSLKNLPA
uniref:Uncharacterized protein n=1 Tax=Eutreptiella gymnastica TaxID=73025 RepID=A0A7S4CY41_9EUGL